MDYQNFENQTFDTLPETITGSNFTGCTMNAAATFDRCNLRGCEFTVPQKFVLSNLVNCVIPEGCEFDRSNVVEEDDEPNDSDEPTV